MRWRKVSSGGMGDTIWRLDVSDIPTPRTDSGIGDVKFPDGSPEHAVVYASLSREIEAEAWKLGALWVASRLELAMILSDVKAVAESCRRVGKSNQQAIILVSPMAALIKRCQRLEETFKPGSMIEADMDDFEKKVSECFTKLATRQSLTEDFNKIAATLKDDR